MKWNNDHLVIDPPSRPKKITATRFATILGLNPWSTPFEVWCEITKTYQKPFEDTIYTIAGKTIEPKQIAYMRKAYAMTNLITPTDMYGADYFKQTWGDFFRETPVLGGMWDSLLMDENGKPEAVLEFKTTKRSEDWKDDVPEYYALQAALYAYLLGVDDVIMVCSFLEMADYEKPDSFTPSAKNTITVDFKVSERYPNFALYVEKAQKWWADHIEKGVSPAFDEKADAEILKALRNNSLSPSTDIAALVSEAEGLKTEIETVNATIAAKEKRLKAINDLIKSHAMEQFRDGDKTVSVRGAKYEWVLSRTIADKFDEAAFKKANSEEYGKYLKPNTTYRLTTNEIKEDK